MGRDGRRFDLPPAGRRIAFTTPGAGGPDEVHVAPLSGGGPEAPTSSDYACDSPQFSQDGGWGAHLARMGRLGPAELCAVRTDGCDDQPLRT